MYKVEVTLCYYILLVFNIQQNTHSNHNPWSLTTNQTNSKIKCTKRNIILYSPAPLSHFMLLAIASTLSRGEASKEGNGVAAALGWFLYKVYPPWN